MAVAARAKYATAACGRRKENTLVQKCRAIRPYGSSATTFQNE